MKEQQALKNPITIFHRIQFRKLITIFFRSQSGSKRIKNPYEVEHRYAARSFFTNNRSYFLNNHIFIFMNEYIYTD